MFRGAHSIQLDAKGRIAMPALYRKKLLDEYNGELVITKHLVDQCLVLYPLPRWEELENTLAGLSSTNQKHRAIKRILLGNASDVQLKNERIMIPSILREMVGLQKQIFLVGDGKSFQIWDKDQWNAQMEEDQTLLIESTDSEQLPDLPF
ncbi:MAG: division/cell wall cluster transcriptional repressor MraZ [Gammaproteobacteria bacterium CG22_combo_CG10-13_8_21_14_all_40_8]|nr:MAG: division/cell wall cluster transcriptional repressor MraZ [Gammaproteobacteria bacterium CG22_combo_CG10-13_8_21_14_all_40_8]